MSEFQPPAQGNLPTPIDNTEVERVLVEVQALDPELLVAPETHSLIELGARIGAEVTEAYGSPAVPKWASGTVEEGVIMSYHNGGEDGHTSVGPRGAGVPRNTLLIAKAVNDAAGREVFDPIMRATAFYAASAHDRYQLCGRALMPEGQGERHGDERLSAEYARDQYLDAGGNSAVAEQADRDVMATAFNPQTSAQNVDREAWRANPTDPALTRDVLEQELVAAADLLGPTGARGPLGAFEYSVEAMCLVQKNQVIQERLRSEHGVEPSELSMEELLDTISRDQELRSGLADTLNGQAGFFSNYLKYSDEAIRAACGKGIDELFPGRQENAAVLARYSEAIRAGENPREIWQQAKTLAGY